MRLKPCHLLSFLLLIAFSNTVLLCGAQEQAQSSSIDENANDLYSRDTTLGDTKRYLVLQLTTLGLANRLRTVADFYTIALYSNRTLLLSWEPSGDCNISFTDMFSEGPEHFKVLPSPLPHDSEDASRYVQMKAARSQLSFSEYAPSSSTFGDGGESSYFAPPALFDSAVHVIYTSYWGSTALAHLPCQHFMATRSKFYQSLVPVRSVIAVVDEVVARFRGRVMVGVHIRGFDAAFDWAVVPPREASAQATRFGDTLSQAMIAKQLKQVQQAFTVQSDRGGREGPREFESLGLFVASNNREVKEAMRRDFPSSVSLEGVLDRNHPLGMRLALAEWLLLSRCDLLLHTYGSSFAMEASQVHRRPLVGLWTEDISVYYHDERLPLCGNMQFMKEFGAEGYSVEYQEGTVDRRKIKTRSVPLRPCSSLQGWGIQNLYCSSL